MDKTNKSVRNILKIKLTILLVLFAFGIIALFLYVGCRDECFECDKQLIKDASKATTLIFRTDSKDVQGIRVAVRGRIDGTARITEIEGMGGKPCRLHEIGPESVRIGFDGDFYSEECCIVYEPIDAKKGEIMVGVKFKTISNEPY
jgi:hypothetical protein